MSEVRPLNARLERILRRGGIASPATVAARQAISRSAGAVAALEKRLAGGRLSRVLPVLALCAGCLWMTGVLLHGGIRGAGDTRDYLTRVDGLQTAGSYFAFLYEERMLNAHMATVWMTALGPRAFVLLVSALTALLPFLVDVILRQNAAGIVFRLAALGFTAGHPELYKWSVFVLTDGFFLIQIVLLLTLITRTALPVAGWVVLPFLLYNLVYTRPTGLLFLPGLAAFAIMHSDRKKRRLLLGFAMVMAVWVAAWILASGGRTSQHTRMAREGFVGGHLLQNPYMGVPIPVPFTETEALGRSVAELCLSYPTYCATYYTQKSLTYFLPVFPKYSVRHNVLNAVYFGSLMTMSGLGLALAAYKLWRSGVGTFPRGGQLATATFCMVTMITVGAFHTLTHIDSDARYLIVWTPVWIVGASLILSMATEPAARGPACEFAS